MEQPAFTFFAFATLGLVIGTRIVCPFQRKRMLDISTSDCLFWLVTGMGPPLAFLFGVWFLSLTGSNKPLERFLLGMSVIMISGHSAWTVLRLYQIQVSAYLGLVQQSSRWLLGVHS